MSVARPIEVETSDARAAWFIGNRTGAILSVPNETLDAAANDPGEFCLLAASIGDLALEALLTHRQERRDA